ncbi:UNVERIFIED_ORG: hypothetical protein GGI57_006569 [Rhizobium aethiopicum]
MLFFQPLACTVDLQACTVDEDVEGSLVRETKLLPFLWRSRFACPPAQRRVIGNSEIQADQLQHRRNKALRLSETQAENQSQRQSSLDRQIGIAWLATACRPLRRPPGRQCLRRDPKRQATAPTKTCLVFRPVRQLKLHLADAMASGGVVFERQRCKHRLLRLPTTYANAINDPRTNAPITKSGQRAFGGGIHCIRNPIKQYFAGSAWYHDCTALKLGNVLWIGRMRPVKLQVV